MSAVAEMRGDPMVIHPIPPIRHVSASEQLRAQSPLKKSVSLHRSNAIEQFYLIEALIDERHLILLLDYDGTLTPIVSDPSKALLSDDVRETLRELPKHFVTGIVSGRSLAKIKSFVNVPGLFYAGSHGFDLYAPDQHCPSSCASGDDHAPGLESSDLDRGFRPDGGSGGGTRHQVASEFLPVLQSVRRECEAGIADISGASVEDNLFSVSLHYRNCARVDVPRVLTLAREVQARHRGIKLGDGKEVVELRPDIRWNKGSAVVWLLEMLGLDGENSTTETGAADLVVPSGMAGDGSGGGGGGICCGAAFGAEGGPLTSKSSSVGSNATGVSSCSSEASSVGSSGGGGGVGRGLGLPPLARPSGGAAAAAAAATAAAATAAAATAAATAAPMNVPESGSPLEGVFTIFIGDDKTDEDAFKVFCPSTNGSGEPKLPRHEGLGILVSEDWRETCAGFTLRNPQEVATFLKLLADLGQRRRLRPFWCHSKIGKSAVAAPRGITAAVASATAAAATPHAGQAVLPELVSEGPVRVDSGAAQTQAPAVAEEEALSRLGSVQISDSAAAAAREAFPTAVCT